MQSLKPAIIGICAQSSNSGKTTLICRLIPVLAQHGIRVSVIKHTHHAIQIDQPGKDSYQMQQAGAIQTLVGDASKWALITQKQTSHAYPDELAHLIEQIDAKMCDLILVEGFKHAAISKIEVHRTALHSNILAAQDSSIIAVASDGFIQPPCKLLDLNDTKAIADFILQYLQSTQ